MTIGQIILQIEKGARWNERPKNMTKRLCAFAEDDDVSVRIPAAPLKRADEKIKFTSQIATNKWHSRATLRINAQLVFLVIGHQYGMFG